MVAVPFFLGDSDDLEPWFSAMENMLKIQKSDTASNSGGQLSHGKLVPVVNLYPLWVG
jgi:hypothetical protein